MTVMSNEISSQDFSTSHVYAADIIKFLAGFESKIWDSITDWSNYASNLQDLKSVYNFVYQMGFRSQQLEKRFDLYDGFAVNNSYSLRYPQKAHKSFSEYIDQYFFDLGMIPFFPKEFGIGTY